MRKEFNYFHQVVDPNVYLCNPDQKIIGVVKAENRSVTLRFNDLSALSFNVSKELNCEPCGTDGETLYDKIKSKRLIYVDNIGWFQITSVNDTINGEHEYKQVTCESHQASLKNRGFVSEERVYMFYNPSNPDDSLYDSGNNEAIPSIVGQCVKQLGIKVNLQLSDIEPTEDYKQWTIVYIDPSLIYDSNSDSNIVRGFSKESTYGYDFLINKAAKAFEVIFEFDYLHHAIKVNPYEKCIKRSDIYLSFDNVVNNMSVKEDAENIVTVLTVNGNGLDINVVNPMGTNYIVDFSYYMQSQPDGQGGTYYPWMSQELIAALEEWKEVYETSKNGYTDLVTSLREKYLLKEESDRKLQKANLMLDDLQHALADYTSKGEEANGINVVETVKLGEKSLCVPDVLTSSSLVDVYQQAPTRNEEKIFVPNGTPVEKSISAIADNYIPSDSNDEENTSIPLYFIDSDTKSYCKFTVASEIGVSRDENNVATVIPNGSSGYVTVGDVRFSVSYDANSSATVSVGGSNFTLDGANGYCFNYGGNRYRLHRSSDNIASIYRYYVDGYERHTYSDMLGGVDESNNCVGWITRWENYASSVQGEGKSIQSQIDDVNSQLSVISDACDIQRYINRKSTALYDELFEYWIEGTYENKNYTTTSSTTMSERIDLANQLAEAARKDLIKNAQPKFTLSVNAINFTNLIEFVQFTDQLELGRIITIERTDSVYYYPALLSMEFNLDVPTDFTLQFSNASKLDETSMTIADLLNESSSTSRTVSSNWSNLTEYTKNKDRIESLIQNPLDRTLRAMQANMSNQEFTIDTTGILGRKWKDDSKATFYPEQVRLVNNVLMFTDDNWETAKLALGKVEYEEYGEAKTAYGLLAEVLVGKMILGEAMKIVNRNNTISLDNAGITILNSDKNVVFAADTNGNINLAGNITWTPQNSPAKALYNKSAEALELPDGFVFSSAPDHDDGTLNGWHKVFNVAKDFYAVYSYDGGATWTDIAVVQAKSDSNVTFDNVIKALLSGGGNNIYGIYPGVIDGQQVLLFNASHILSGALAVGQGTKNTSGYALYIDKDKGTFYIDAPGFSVDSAGNLDANSGTISGLAIEKKKGVNSVIHEYTKQNVEVTITIPQGTIGTTDGAGVWYWYSTGATFTLSDLGVHEQDAVIGGYSVSVPSDPFQQAFAAGYETKDGKTAIRLTGAVKKKSSESLSKAEEVHTTITFSYYTVSNRDVDYSILHSPDDGFRIQTYNNVSVLSIKDARMQSATANTLCAAEGYIGNVLMKNKAIECMGVSLNFDETSNSNNYRAEVKYVGNIIFVYISSGGVLPDDKAFSILYTDSDSGAETTAVVVVKANEVAGYTELPILGEVKSAVFAHDGSTELGFTMRDIEDNSSKKGLKLSTGAFFINDGEYNSTFGCRTGGTLGTNDNWWGSLYSITIRGKQIYQNGTQISTSDRNKKNSINYLGSDANGGFEKLFDELKPATFKFDDGTSGRTHCGFIAQDILQSMRAADIDETECAIYCSWMEKDKSGQDTETCGIRYEEILPLAVYEIQKLKKTVRELTEEINGLKGENI